MPIQNKIEMGQDLARVIDMLGKDPNYPELFRKAFGDSTVTRERLARALAQFLRSLISYQSKYDEGLAKTLSASDDFENFTAQENRGKRLFLRDCASCHLPRGQDAHFTMLRPQNNGLDADVVKTDGGVGDLTLNRFEVGLFKSPSLRNVEYTAPYMHDGRFATLEAVIDHYSKDVKPHPNLGGRLRRRLNLDAAEKAALVAFLKTLSDPKFISDPKFSDPWLAAPPPEVKAAEAPRGLGEQRERGNGPPGRSGFAPGGPAERALAELKLTDKKKDAAEALVKAHQDEVRKLMELARADLLLKMKDILTDDEFKKFKESLENRPAPGARAP
jgi:hypothetical protein